MGTDEDIALGLSPVNNFQPIGPVNAVEKPETAQTEASTNNQASVAKVVPVVTLQPNSSDSEEAEGEKLTTDRPVISIDELMNGDGQDLPVGTISGGLTRCPTIPEPKPKHDVYFDLPDEQKADIQRIVDGFKYIQGARDMGDEEWSDSQVEVKPNPVEVTPIDTKGRASMPVEFGSFRERYKALEDGHATREAEILKKMREREELLTQMRARLDEENASLAAFKVNRLA